MACANHIRTADGRSIPSPRVRLAPVHPLLRSLSHAIATAIRSGDAEAAARAALALVTDHIRTAPYEELNPELADAIEDGMLVESLEGDESEACEVAPHEVPGFVDFDSTPISGNRILAVAQ